MTTKKLGFGMMRLPLTDASDAGSIDIELTKKMVDTFIERGFTYFDTAWMYCDHKSEDAVKEVLTSRYPRDAYTLATKLHSGYLTCKEDRDKIFNEQLRKTGVDFFDYYLIHDVREEPYRKYEELDCFNWILDKKKKGLVKKIGFSFHSTSDLLDRVLTEHPEFDFVQLQLNYLDWDNNGVQSRKCYETAVAHNKPVIVMEPVKGGTLAKLPSAADALLKAYNPNASAPSWAIRFVASLDNVFMILSGMSNMEQLLDNTSLMSAPQPLNNDEHAIIDRVVKIINSRSSIPCTGCSYCTGGCPSNIPIPKHFSLYNAEKQESKDKDWTPHGEYYYDLSETYGKAEDCIACGQCEDMCPQGLPIIDLLKTVSEYFANSDRV